MSKSAKSFIECLKDETFRERLTPSLLDVEEGDWDKIVQIAQKEGFDFTREELKEAVPDSFFKNSGRNPQIGWDRSTLEK